ncbi:MAG TPA: DR2241 family protein, partial [Verrucomicrobiae bacterium]|nr:DR2241 family protein [Verrucomicrobiae bacterium]
MMPLNPALLAFIRTVHPERVWGQVLVTRDADQFTLRHISDRDVPFRSLRSVAISELQRLSMFNPAGQFRPLKSAPDLPCAWICACKTAAELWRALQELYPGSIPDWFALQKAPEPITNYRDFTNRQSGMYRVTQLLRDEQAAQVIRACCHPRFCLKRRVWTVAGLATDPASMKSD